MAATIGKNGSARIGANSIGFMDSWTLTQSVDVVDITAYGSSFHDKAQTLKDWSVEFSGTLDRSDTNQAALLDYFEDGTLGNVAIRLYTSTNTYWSGNVLISGGSVVSSVADKVTVSFSAEGNGALTYT
jgi:predicted secreted protein